MKPRSLASSTREGADTMSATRRAPRRRGGGRSRATREGRGSGCRRCRTRRCCGLAQSAIYVASVLESRVSGTLIGRSLTPSVAGIRAKHQSTRVVTAALPARRTRVRDTRDHHPRTRPPVEGQTSAATSSRDARALEASTVTRSVYLRPRSAGSRLPSEPPTRTPERDPRSVPAASRSGCGRGAAPCARDSSTPGSGTGRSRAAHSPR